MKKFEQSFSSDSGNKPSQHSQLDLIAGSEFNETLKDSFIKLSDFVEGLERFAISTIHSLTRIQSAH